MEVPRKLWYDRKEQKLSDSEGFCSFVEFFCRVREQTDGKASGVRGIGREYDKVFYDG